LTKLEASGSYQQSEKFKIDLIGRFYSYQTKNEAFAWNLPQLEFVLRGSYNLYDKFLVNLSAKVETGRKARVYSAGEDVIEKNEQFAKPLGAIVDINLGVEYRYNTRVSAFLQINNLASQQYYRWYNYPVQPIQVMAGVTARF
jgi:outer membrane receptor protein involved in Fe transport